MLSKLASLASNDHEYEYDRGQQTTPTMAEMAETMSDARTAAIDQYGTYLSICLVFHLINLLLQL